jgi:hypothetical protein
MAKKQTRRRFVGCSIATAAAAAGIGSLSLEEKTLLAEVGAAGGGAAAPAEPVKPASKSQLPTGKIGDLTISRVILGGNLIGGWAHSRELMYVSDLVVHYHTDQKVLDTFQLAEEHGVTCFNSHPNAGKLVQRYRKERGGKMLWMVQAFPDERGDFGPCVRAAVEQGVNLIQIQGGVCDEYAEKGKIDLLDKGIRYIQAQGLPAGIAAHTLDVLKACEKAGVKADFYVKTLHTHDYFSAKRPDQSASVIHSGHDNFWDPDPAETIAYMAKVDKPWVAFKVLAAGGIPPAKALPYTFTNGADFAMVGMFDFQIADDVKVANAALKKAAKRERPWRG